MKAREALTAPGSDQGLRVLLALDLGAVSDLQLLMGELQPGNPHHLEIAGVAREGTLVYADAVEKEADVVLLSPTIPGYSPEVIQHQRWRGELRRWGDVHLHSARQFQRHRRF